VVGLLLLDPSGDFRQAPAKEVEPFLAALASDAYTKTIEGYWRSLLDVSQPTTQERIMADLRATPRETVFGFFDTLRRYDPLPALRA
jgi:hypothetical protein